MFILLPSRAILRSCVAVSRLSAVVEARRAAPGLLLGCRPLRLLKLCRPRLDTKQTTSREANYVQACRPPTSRLFQAGPRFASVFTPLVRVPLPKPRDRCAGEPNRRTSRNRLALEAWRYELDMRTALSLRGRIAHTAKLRAPRAPRHRAIYAASALRAEPPRKQPQPNNPNCTKITG